MEYRRYMRLGGRTAGERRGELSDEIESHIAMRAEGLVRRGETPDRARQLAEARFGDRNAVFESARERDEMMKRRDGFAAVQRDVRLAVRVARRAPGAAALTIATFALGIGLATAMFTLVYGVLLRPLPFPEPDRLVVVQGMDSVGNAIPRVSYLNWRDLADRNRTLESTALHEPTRLAIASDAGAYRVDAQVVTAGFFDVLRPRLVFGRGFTAADMEQGSGAVVVSESLWRRELGARRESGMALRIENEPRVVIGVVADADVYPSGTQVWAPLPPQRQVGGFFRNFIGAVAIARLRTGVTQSEAESDLSAIARQVHEAEPESDYTYGAPLVPLHEWMVGGSHTYLLLLLGAVGAVLLLACANLAALNLARATHRTQEVAMRYALGASRWSVIRQLVIEQLSLAIAGGVLGVLLAWGATRLALAAAADQLPRTHEIGLAVPVLLFALAISLAAGVLAGLAPAWKASTASARSLVGGRGVVRGGSGISGAVLVGGEIAVAVLLLIGAGLLVRSFQTVLSRDIGFAPAGVAAADISLTAGQYGTAEQRLLQWETMLTRIEADPAVEVAAVANWIPTGRAGTGYLLVDGFDEDPRGTGYDVVSEGYFETLRIPLLFGRTFESTDAADGERVAVINRTMAERYWPGGDPIGQRFSVPGMEGQRENAPSIRVIGVVGNVRHHGYEDDRAGSQVYVLYRQVPVWATSMTLIARHAAGDAAAAGAVMRREVRALDPALAVEPQGIETRLGTLMTERRLVTSVLSGFGTLALLLAMIGVYGMLSFAVAQRTQEIGIRAALGADHSGIMRLIVGSALRVIVPGLAAGMLLAWWLTRLLQSMLVDVTHTDPVAWGTAVAALAGIALLAALVPARRAARMDPLVALRTTV